MRRNQAIAKSTLHRASTDAQGLLALGWDTSLRTTNLLVDSSAAARDPR
jgi:hypothetical protein